MKDIIQNREEDEFIRQHQLMELIKKNTEINKKQKGEPFSAREREHYETPDNLWRDTLAIKENRDNIFNEEREAFVKNCNKFLDNLNLDNDPSSLQTQVNEYLEQVKVYNKNRHGRLKQLEMMETKRASDELDNDDSKEKQLLKCVRREKKHDDLSSVPLGEKQREKYIKSRKPDVHLDMGFMPREQFYEQEREESRRKMEEQLKRINENLEKRNAKKRQRQQDSPSPQEEKEIHHNSMHEIRESESSFFGRLLSFIPFTCAGRKGDDYGYISDEDPKESRKRARQQKQRRRPGNR
jgi:hypothetical protein